ncbi:MAG: radical SAM protein [Thermoprotei archaeon]|nr:MAG: radical SAM protein [Thermoprotei archaeon]
MRAVILDGYSDEPAGLGVPPYLDVYPRYVAGAIWEAEKGAEILYFTVDAVRDSIDKFVEVANKSDLVVFLAGVLVPGKYLGGDPIKPEEIKLWSSLIERPVKVLGGPVARFGMGIEGGTLAVPPEELGEHFDVIAKGDVEVVVHELVREGLSVERVDPSALREGYELVDRFAVRGAALVTQHPNYGLNLIVELETYRGCPRYVVGGCSFCVEPLYGEVVFRSIEGVLAEVEALHRFGVRNFRVGRQSDLYAYMAKDTGWLEFPRPNPDAIERLFRGIRSVAPDLEVLHIDNVNPGTVYHYPEEAKLISKIIIEYHTPGDVAAFGVESADPRVVELNNLKVMPDEAFEAVRILNEVGAIRGWNGLPELLPGINLVHGLLGETKETFVLNYQFLKEILDSGLMVRRINIRQVLPIPGTKMWEVGDRIIAKHRRLFRAYRDKIRREIDVPMLRRVVPKGTVLRRVFTELHQGKRTLARQVGTYPLLVQVPMKVELRKFMDFVVVSHSYRSVTGIPYPLSVNRAPPKVLGMVPGMNRELVRRLLLARPVASRKQLEEIVGPGPAKYLVP